MKIILTGSLGNISKPLAIELLRHGHSVTITSSKPEKRPDIEALGASAASASVADAGFLAATFTSAIRGWPSCTRWTLPTPPPMN